MTISYKNQFKPWQPGVNTTNDLFYREHKELIWDIEDMFKVYSKSKVVIDNTEYMPDTNVTNHVICGCTEYDDDMLHIDMILRGEL